MVTAGYRRSFHAAATAIARPAEQLLIDELFDHLLAIGRAQPHRAHLPALSP